MKILLVEDHQDLVEAMKEYFLAHKVYVDSFNDGLEGYKAALNPIYDAIVLDIMLPHKSGDSILKDLRAKGIETPIIMLTAKIATDDKVNCLLSGANDYVTKPFVLDELMARLLVVTRKTFTNVGNLESFGDLKIDKKKRTISKDDQTISLSVKEFELLELLIKHKDDVLEKSVILSAIWGNNDANYYNSSEVYVSFLRKKLKTLNSNVEINSIRNNGYSINIK